MVSNKHRCFNVTVYGLEKLTRLNMYNLEDRTVLDIDTRQERPTSPIVSYLTLDANGQTFVDFEIYNATLDNDSILKQKRDCVVKGFVFDHKHTRNYRRIYTKKGAKVFGLNEMNFVRRVKITGFPLHSLYAKQIRKVMREAQFDENAIDFCMSTCRVDYQIDVNDNLLMHFSNLLEVIPFKPIEIHTERTIPCTISDALSDQVKDEFDEIEELNIDISPSESTIEEIRSTGTVSGLRLNSKNKLSLRTKGIDILSKKKEFLPSSSFDSNNDKKRKRKDDETISSNSSLEPIPKSQSSLGPEVISICTQPSSSASLTPPKLSSFSHSSSSPNQ